MRLSYETKPFDMEEIKKMKNIIEQINNDALKVVGITNAEEIVRAYARFIYTIEALQRENEQLRESAILAHKIADAHIAQIEQLRAQVARLEYAVRRIDKAIGGNADV